MQVQHRNIKKVLLLLIISIKIVVVSDYSLAKLHKPSHSLTTGVERNKVGLKRAQVLR